MKKALTLALLLLLFIALPVSALAEGDGSGGGSDEPLSLANSSVPDGSTGVPVDVTIALTFSKNVVNMSVKDNNKTCFNLNNNEGGIVSISVLMGDDQVDPTIKRIINIKPQADLASDTTYKLTISGNLTSKSGAQLGENVVLSFTTKGVPSPSPTPSPTPEPSATPVPSPSATSTSPEPSAAMSPVPSPAASSPTSVPSPAPSPSIEPDDAASSDSQIPEQSMVVAPASSTAPTDAQLTAASANESENAGDAVYTVPINAEANNSWVIYVVAGGVVVAAGGAVRIIRNKKK